MPLIGLLSYLVSLRLMNPIKLNFGLNELSGTRNTNVWKVYKLLTEFSLTDTSVFVGDVVTRGPADNNVVQIISIAKKRPKVERVLNIV